MKKTYQEPATEIVMFEAADVITTSKLKGTDGGATRYWTGSDGTVYDRITGNSWNNNT